MKWKDIKIGDTLKDGSIVTQIHRTHQENSCKLIYDNDKEFICAYRHILLVDIHNLPEEGKQELDAFCSFVPLEESYEVHCDRTLSKKEQEIIDNYSVCVFNGNVIGISHCSNHAQEHNEEK